MRLPDPKHVASCGMLCCLKFLFRATREAANASRAAADAAWKAGSIEEFNVQLERHYEQRRHIWGLFARLDAMTVAWGGDEDDEAFLDQALAEWKRGKRSCDTTDV